MNDEASTHYNAIIDQMTLGNLFYIIISALYVHYNVTRKMVPITGRASTFLEIF